MGFIDLTNQYNRHERAVAQAKASGKQAPAAFNFAKATDKALGRKPQTPSSKPPVMVRDLVKLTREAQRSDLASRRVADFTQLGGATGAVFQVSDRIRPLLDKVTASFAGQDAEVVSATRALTDRLWRARHGEGLNAPDSDLSAVAIGADLQKLLALYGAKQASASPAQRALLARTAAEVGEQVAQVTGGAAQVPVGARSDALELARRQLIDFSGLGYNAEAPFKVSMGIFAALGDVVDAFAGEDEAIVARTRQVTDKLRLAGRGDGLGQKYSAFTADAIGADLRLLFDLYEARKRDLSAARVAVLDQAVISVGKQAGWAAQHFPRVR